MAKQKNKMKTKKSAAKRFKVTKTGKILRGRAFTSHLKSKKSSKRNRNLRKQKQLTGKYAQKIRRILQVRTTHK